MSEPEIPQEPNEVSDSWQQMVQAALGVVLLLGAVAMFHYYAPVTAQSPPPDELQKQVTQLTQQVARSRERAGDASAGAEPVPEFHWLHSRRVPGRVSEPASANSGARVGDGISGG